MKLKSMKKYSVWIEVIKKRWRRALLFFGVVGVISAPLGLYNNTMSLFQVSNNEIHKQGEENTATIVEATRSEAQNTIQAIEKTKGLDCYNLSSSWTADDNEIRFDNQFFILKDNKQIGSASYRTQFQNFFTLDLTFIPSAISAPNTTLSIKDDEENELSITIGDTNFRNVRVKYLHKGEILINKITKELPLEINPTEKVKLRVQTAVRANDVLLTGIIAYTSAKKQSKMKENIIDLPLPENFTEPYVSLLLGLKRNNNEVGEKRFRMIDCRISEMPRFN